MQRKKDRKIFLVIPLVISLFATADFSASLGGQRTVDLQEDSATSRAQDNAGADELSSSLKSEISDNYHSDFINEHSFRKRASRKKGQRFTLNAQQGPKKVCVVYLLPADKPIRKDYEIAVGNAILHLQNFYQLQIGAGYSFSTNDPIVEVYRTSVGPWTWVTNLSVDMGYTFFLTSLPR